jgi:hypothetical protein
MTPRQALLSVIEQLPDQQVVSLLALARKLVTHLDAESTEPGLSIEQLADLRSRLSQFAEEWDSPEMEIYDDYDTHKSELQKGFYRN